MGFTNTNSFVSLVKRSLVCLLSGACCLGAFEVACADLRGQPLDPLAQRAGQRRGGAPIRGPRGRAYWSVGALWWYEGIEAEQADGQEVKMESAVTALQFGRQWIFPHRWGLQFDLDGFLGQVTTESAAASILYLKDGDLVYGATASFGAGGRLPRSTVNGAVSLGLRLRKVNYTEPDELSFSPASLRHSTFCKLEIYLPVSRRIAILQQVMIPLETSRRDGPTWFLGALF